jgi:hypothetical protein
MNTKSYLNRLLCIIPLIWVLGFLAMGIFGYLQLHKVPVYGVDPDPYALHIDWVNTVMLFSFTASLFTIPINVFCTITLIVKKVAFTIGDKVAILISLVSIMFFFLCKFGFTTLFNWVMD